MTKASTLGPGSLRLGETASAREFATQLTKAILTPNVDSEDDVPVLSGDTLPGEDTETWTIGGTVLQDYDLDSLEDWCFENRGVQVPFEFVPSTSGQRTWSGTCKIHALAVGGDVKKRNTSDFEFRIIGDPVPGEIG